MLLCYTFRKFKFLRARITCIANYELERRYVEQPGQNKRTNGFSRDTGTTNVKPETIPENREVWSPYSISRKKRRWHGAPSNGPNGNNSLFSGDRNDCLYTQQSITEVDWRDAGCAASAIFHPLRRSIIGGRLVRGKQTAGGTPNGNGCWAGEARWRWRAPVSRQRGEDNENVARYTTMYSELKDAKYRKALGY